MILIFTKVTSVFFQKQDAPYSDRAKKDSGLETLRGLASVAVLFWHIMLGFYPAGLEILQNQVWFGLMNGPAAVSFFFVLSGFVLTRSFFLTHDSNQILRNALKRWPRLAMPVLIAALGSWALFHFGLYRFGEAGGIIESEWLTTFANAFLHNPQQATRLSLSDAVLQGSFMTFFRGDDYFDTNLWTMRYEFIGSFVAFFLAMLIVLTTIKYLDWYFIFIAFALCHYAGSIYGAFPLGVALAAKLPRNYNIISGFTAIVILCAGVYLIGYRGQPGNAFKILSASPLGGSALFLNMVGSVLLIVAAETSTSMRRALASNWGVVLGRLSFPLYLVHVPVLCSLGCGVFLAVLPGSGMDAAKVIAGGVTIVAAFLFAFPLSVVNEWWIRRLNIVVSNLMRKDRELAVPSPHS
jgi:peptidoglycan/LPS O-acetylase OafA/YrhL